MWYWIVLSMLGGSTAAGLILWITSGNWIPFGECNEEGERAFALALLSVLLALIVTAIAGWLN